MSIDFDSHAATYRDAVERSVRFTGKGLDFFTKRKVELLADMAEAAVGPLATLSTLDVGCGPGVTDQLLVGRFGRVSGVDTSEEMVRRARERNPGASYEVYDGRRLPFADATFDVTFAICVFHHVVPVQWDAFARELHRVTRTGGLICVFEHNPYNPLTRRAVNTCEFDRDAVLLPMRRTVAALQATGARLVDRRYFLFAPFGGRVVEAGERLLAFIPLGGQYLVAARRIEAAAEPAPAPDGPSDR